MSRLAQYARAAYNFRDAALIVWIATVHYPPNLRQWAADNILLESILLEYNTEANQP